MIHTLTHRYFGWHLACGPPSLSKTHRVDPSHQIHTSARSHARRGSGSPLRRFVVSVIFRYHRRVSICLKLSYVSCGTARTRESMRRNAASYLALERSPSGTILAENARCRRLRSNFYEEVATAGINIPLLAQQRYAGNCCLHRQRYSIIAVYPEFVDPPARRAAFALHLAKVLLRNDQRP